MRQFYLKTESEDPPSPGDQVTLDKEESHHLATVLRGGRQESLDLVDGKGTRFTGRSVGKQGKLEVIEIDSVIHDEEESRQPLLVLCCSVVKGKRFEWALEKAVELGAHRIIPIATDRGTIEPRPGKLTRWNTIMVSALKQSCRSWLPILEDTSSLANFFSNKPSGLVLFGAVPGDFPTQDNPVVPWNSLLDAAPIDRPETLVVMIGPEGGWSPGERDFLLSNGAIPVNFGPFVLRTETAAVAGLFALQTIRSHWSGSTDPSGS